MVEDICKEHDMQTSIDTLHRYAISLIPSEQFPQRPSSIVNEAKERDQALAATGTYSNMELAMALIERTVT